MPNFENISRQIKKLSIQELDFDRVVCMSAIYRSGLISVAPTNEQLLEMKRKGCVQNFRSMSQN